MNSCHVLKRFEKQRFADLHLSSFHGFFLSSIGKNFLVTYYKAVLRSNETIAVQVTNEAGEVQGFCTGCIKSKGYHKRIVYHNLIAFITQGLRVFFRKPADLWRLYRNLDKIYDCNDDGHYAEIISLGVLPEYHGMGLGRELVTAFEQEAKRRACTKVALTTDYYHNDEVIAFYRHCGYDVFCEFETYPNRKMYKFMKDLS